jgi:putative transcriptional regulator
MTTSFVDMTTEQSFLDGKLLMAMPAMGDQRFAQTVIYMCAHSEEGAMGLVVNKAVDYISFPELLEQLDIEVEAPVEDILVHAGGPVETGRGFVLHSSDFEQESTLVVSKEIGLTATADVLTAIAKGVGPRRSLLALGYSGWAPGQLEDEISANGWLHTDADEDLVFGAGLDEKWPRAIGKLGIDVSLFSGDAGHA